MWLEFETPDDVPLLTTTDDDVRHIEEHRFGLPKISHLIITHLRRTTSKRTSRLGAPFNSTYVQCLDLRSKGPPLLPPSSPHAWLETGAKDWLKSALTLTGSALHSRTRGRVGTQLVRSFFDSRFQLRTQHNAPQHQQYKPFFTLSPFLSPPPSLGGGAGVRAAPTLELDLWVNMELPQTTSLV